MARAQFRLGLVPFQSLEDRDCDAVRPGNEGLRTVDGPRADLQRRAYPRFQVYMDHEACQRQGHRTHPKEACLELNTWKRGIPTEKSGTRN